MYETDAAGTRVKAEFSVPFCHYTQTGSMLRRAGQFLRLGLGDYHHGRTEQASVQRPSLGPGLDDGTGRVKVALLLRHRLMQVGIERPPHRVLRLDPVSLQGANKAAFDAMEAF